MMKYAGFLVLALMVSSAYSQQCLSGLTVFNKTNHLVLPIGQCDVVVDSRSLREAPVMTYTKALNNETYLLMMLESIPSHADVYILHWLVSGVKAHDSTTLITIPGGRDLTSGYFPPVNQTHYEFRLYNSTGKIIWESISMQERMNFYPAQWLPRNRVYTEPLAKTTFNIKSFIAGPPWSPYPVGQPQHPVVQPQPAVSPPHLPVVQPQYPVGQPQYPVGQPQYPVGQPQYPVGQPLHPIAGQQPQIPVQPSVQPQQPVHPPHQPHYPPQQPSIPINPQQPQYPPQQPQYPPQQQSSSTLHVPQKTYTINGTYFSIHPPGRPFYNPLNINSTIYTADSYNKKFHLSPYLIIDNTSYIWRNRTHSPGNGNSIYINGTQYVPFNPPSKEVHHHHYHKGKNSATSFTGSNIIAIILLPFFFNSIRT